MKIWNNHIIVSQAIGIALFSAAILPQAGAQGLTIGLDGGWQGTQYTLLNGRNKPLPAGSVALLYTFGLGGNWGLITGITAGVYRTQATLPNGTSFSYYQIDDEGSAFQYGMKTRGYAETQQFLAAGVPLQIQFHTTGPASQWYINAGGKFIFPSSDNVTITAQQLTLSGYYPDYDINVSNVPQHGFGTINNWKASTTAVLRPSAALTAATGLSFLLSPGTRLYTGLYAEYGLTDLKSKSDSMPFVTYSPTGITAIKASGVLNTQNAGPMKMFAIGVQVRLSFGAAKTKHVARPTKEIESPNPSSPATATNPPSSRGQFAQRRRSNPHREAGSFWRDRLNRAFRNSKNTSRPGSRNPFAVSRYPYIDCRSHLQQRNRDGKNKSRDRPRQSRCPLPPKQRGKPQQNGPQRDRQA